MAWAEDSGVSQRVDIVEDPMETFPYGSKDSNNAVLGPKFYNINGIWALSAGAACCPQGHVCQGPLGFRSSHSTLRLESSTLDISSFGLKQSFLAQ